MVKIESLNDLAEMLRKIINYYYKISWFLRDFFIKITWLFL